MLNSVFNFANSIFHYALKYLQTTHISRFLHIYLRKYLLVFIAGFGLLGGIIFSFTNGRAPPLPANQLTFPTASPFDHVVSGIGLVEANTQNINISATTSGIIESIFVKEGYFVNKGDPLFTLEQRPLKAELALREKELNVLVSTLDVEKVNLADQEDQLKRIEKLSKGVSVSIDQLQKQGFAVKRSQAQILKITEDIERATSVLALTQVNLDLLTTRAPVDGTILKVRTRIGEFVGQTQNVPSAILMGNITPLHLRVQIDENDAWRFVNDKSAKAYLKSNGAIYFDLKFVRIDPYAGPKQSLSGDSRELVDTRVIEVVYEILGTAKNLYIGQQLDVFIEAEKSA